MISRRSMLLSAFAALATACRRSAPDAQDARDPHDARDASAELAAIEASIGGRLGLFAIDTATGKHIARREDERFAMCSTFKWTLAAAVLARVDRGELSLDESIHYNASDVLEYAPTTRAHLAEGALSIDALARAAVTVSDNTAANLLLTKIDGPAGFTRFARQLGDDVTRLDRNEPTLNLNVRGDVRDTTSPRAMAGLLRRILLEDALSAASRERLLGWLRACETGRHRLRAGLPADWTVGDKTGTGLDGAFNDVAIVFPRLREGVVAGGGLASPILIAAYMSDGPSGEAVLSAAHARVGRVVAEHLGGGGPATLRP